MTASNHRLPLDQGRCRASELERRAAAEGSESSSGKWPSSSSGEPASNSLARAPNAFGNLAAQLGIAAPSLANVSNMPNFPAESEVLVVNYESSGETYLWSGFSTLKSLRSAAIGACCRVRLGAGLFHVFPGFPIEHGLDRAHTHTIFPAKLLDTDGRSGGAFRPDLAYGRRIQFVLCALSTTADCNFFAHFSQRLV